MHRIVTLLVSACFWALPVLAGVRPPTNRSQLPPAFVANVGQVQFMSGKPAAHVDAVFQVGSTTAMVHATGMHIVQQVPSEPSAADKTALALRTKKQREEEDLVDLYRMDMMLIGANKNARLEWQRPTSGVSRFINQRGDNADGRVAKHCEGLYYHDVWPGIDMRLYVVAGTMEYDFIVHPGADPNRIVFSMQGAEGVDFTSDKGLRFRTPLGTMSEAAPYSYVYKGFEAKHNKVESEFVVDGRTVRFSVGAYDKTQTLVIDPRRTWATYFGYNNSVTDLNGCVDVFGNVYMSGSTSATNLPEVTGVLQKRYKATGDGFIAKFSEFGKFLWCTYFGGSGADRVTSVTTDQHGNVYACGRTASEINTLPALLGVGSAPWGDPDSLGVSNGFVLGLSTSGAWIDHWFLYGRDEDAVNDITFRNDRLAIVGTSRSPRICEKVGTPYIHDDFNNFQNEDIFVAQFSRSTTQTNRWNGDWLSFAGGDWDDQGVSVAMDAAGAVYIGAMTQGLGIQVTDGSTVGGAGDFFVAKFTGGVNTATHNWGGVVGGNALDVIRDIAVDAAGGLVAVGYTTSTNFPVKNAMKILLEGAFDGFIRKYATVDGSIQWSTLHGGQFNEVLSSVSVDQSNRIWVCGASSNSPDMPVSTDAFQSTVYNVGQWSVNTGYFAQIRADGQALLYGSYYGAPPDNPLPPFNMAEPKLEATDDLGSCELVAISCDANANVFLVHLAQTLHLDTTAGAYQDSSKLDHTFHRQYVPFLSLFTNCADQDITATINGSAALCDNETRQIIGPSGFTSYLWSNGATTKNITVSDSGRYIVIATNADGCRYRDTVFLTKNSKPLVDAGVDVSRCKDTVVMLSAAVTSGTAPYKYKWTRIESGPEYIDADTLQTPRVNPPSTSRYEVVVTDAVGCIGRDTIRITIVDPKPTGPTGTVDFGTLDPCEVSKDGDVILTNPMPYDLRLDGFTSDIASIVTSLSPPPVIPANGTLVVSVRISPTVVGISTGTMRFTGSPCAWSISVPYRVEKARLTATVSPTTLGFGASADCETVQRDSSVVIRNGTSDVMTVNPGTITPNGQPFSIVSPTVATDIQANDSLVVVIRYAPTATGVFSAAIDFPFTAGTCTGSLAVNLNASRSGVTLSATPATVDVGTLGGCQDYVDTVLTLTNSGDVTITTTLPTIAGVAFTPAGPFTLAAGASETIAVRITPSAQGAFTFTGDVQAQPCAITRTLTYTGTKAGATVSVPAELNFGELSVCGGQDFAIRSFTIEYNGAGNANVVTVTQGPNIESTLLSGVQLINGVPQSFDVRWAPTADGAFVDSLVLVVEPCSIRRVIRLVGERTSVGLTASTPLVPLGAITGPQIGQAIFVNSGTDTLDAVASALTPDVSVTSTVPTTLTGILPGGSIRVNYELNCNGRTDVLDSIQVSAVLPCPAEALTVFTGTCSATPIASADIQIDTARVRTGETFLVAMRIVRSTGLNAVNARAWTARISYNPGVVVGTGATPDCFTGTFAPCTIDVSGIRTTDTIGTLTLLNFRAVLGTDSVTPLTIESFEWTDATVATGTRSDGRVVLTDICMEGGARLLKPKDGAFAVELKPTPVVQHLTITARDLGSDPATYTIHSLIGARVTSGVLQPDVTGTAETTVDASALGAGSYVLTIDARGHVFRQIFFINR